MKRFINVFYYIALSFIFLSFIFRSLAYPGSGPFGVLGLLCFALSIVATIITCIIYKKTSFLNLTHHIFFLFMCGTLFLRYMYWKFWDVPGFFIITGFIITSIWYLLKEKERKLLTTKLSTILFLLLIIPMLFNFKNGPRKYLPEDWNTPDKDNSEYRNENWAWIEEGDFGKGQWVPIANNNTVENGDYTLFFFNGSIRETGRMFDAERVDTTTYFNLNKTAILYDIHLEDSIYKYYINNGKYLAHFKTGELMAAGIIKNHKESNNWIKYYQNGNIEYKIESKKDTVYKIFYFESGVMEDYGTYVNKMLEGTARKWHSNGQLKNETQSENDIQSGHSKSYYDNGQIEQESFWINGDPHGNTKAYYKNGQIKEDANYLYGNKNGSALSWYSNGNKKVERGYKNDLKEGVIKIWYENGNKKQTGNYVNGLSNGPLKMWFKNGKIEFEGDIVNDMKQGICTWHFENGQLECSGNYFNDEPDDLIIMYNEEGQLVSKINYKRGIQDGKSKFYKEGILVQTEIYENGDFIETIIEE